MFERQRTGSLLCPNCRQLVGVNDPECFHCGRKNPGMWGYAGVLRIFQDETAFVWLVMWVCGALYLASLAIDPSGVGGLLQPSLSALVVLGASGAYPVFGFGHYWSVLSASWLHGSLLHIFFNMMWLRDLGPAVGRLYGNSRTVLLWVISGACGFLASSLAGLFLPDLPIIGGAPYTIGASASVFGLFGALQHYSGRTSNSLLKQTVRGWLLAGVLMGFLFPRIDNWAHAGGFAGGWLASWLLDPLQPEKPRHLALAGLALAASALAVVASLVSGFALLGGRG